MLHPGIMQRREHRRNEEREQAAPFHFANQIEGGFHILVSPGLPAISVTDWKPIIAIQRFQTTYEDAGPVFNLEGFGHPH